MKICFVVRSIYSQVITYTTTHLAYEAQKRGHKVFYTTVNSLSLSPKGDVMATVVSMGQRHLEGRRNFLQMLQGNQAERLEVNLSEFDAIFLRYNPVDETADTQRGHNPAIEFGRLLKSQGVFVANDPSGLTKASSKLYLTGFPEAIRAETLVTRSTLKIKEFIQRLKKPVILKPLAGYGGQDVFFIKSPKDLNLNQIIATVSKNGYVIAQQYIPAVKKGDKRLLLLNGSPIFVGNRAAIYRRMSPKGDVRSNMHVGGTRKTVPFTEVEEKICSEIRSKLIADGLYLVGADIVGNKLLELNVNCPGGINNINELYRINVGEVIIADLEKRVQLWKAARASSLRPVTYIA